jgi:uncharacterized repeat protein (TIGR01451 family)
LAVDDLDVIGLDETLTDTVAGNDVFAPNSVFTGGALSDPAAGVLTFNTDGSFTFDPAATFAGVVTFPYTVCLPAPNGAQCSSAVQTIVVGPLAMDDSDTVVHDLTLTDTVTTGDTFPTDSVFAAGALSNSAAGVLTFNADGSFTFDPAVTFAGVVTFSYTVCLPVPNSTVCDTAVQTIVVGPLAVNDSDIVAHDVTLTDTVAGNDVFAPNSVFTPGALSDPAAGVLTFNADGSFTFDPAATFAGVVTFPYTVCLPAPNATVCSSAVQTIIVGPLAVDDTDRVAHDVTLNDTVATNDVIALPSVFIAGPLNPAAAGALDFGPDGSFSFDPDAGLTGVVSFPYTVCLPAPNNQVCHTAVQTIIVDPAPFPTLTTTKTTSSFNYGTVGEVLSYSIMTTNSGNVVLTGVAISDPTAAIGVCSPITPATLAPGESISCSATHATTQADLDNGSVVNTATGTGTSPTGALIAAASEPVTVPARQNPRLSVTKSTTATSFRQVGDSLVYQIIAANVGNITLTGVTVDDPNAVLTGCAPAAPARLAPGESMTCSATHAVSRSDLTAGTVVNTASASASTSGVCSFNSLVQSLVPCPAVQGVSQASNSVTLRSLAAGRLIETGSDIAPLLAAATMALMTGLALVWARRKRYPQVVHSQ